MYNEQLENKKNENTIHENTHTPTMTANESSLAKTHRDRHINPSIITKHP